MLILAPPLNTNKQRPKSTKPIQDHCFILTSSNRLKWDIIAITSGYKQTIRIDKLTSIYIIARYNAPIIVKANKPVMIDNIISAFGKKNDERVITTKNVSKTIPIRPLANKRVIIPTPSEKANLAELGKIATLNEANRIRKIPCNSLLALNFILTPRKLLSKRLCEFRAL